MSINTVFIPCAGKGTRMGEMGKRLPKPLWPIFELTMLELQIKYYKSVGFERFIINTHHLADQFEAYKNEIEILHEPVLLGSGGGLHNLKRNFPNIKKILVSNPDVLFDLDDREWVDLIRIAIDESFDNVLLGLPCRSGESYNQLEIDEFGELEKVSSAPLDDYVTYSGVGIIDLESFPLVEGESSFFESVINNKFNRTKVVSLGRKVDYWDFGTLELYVENLNKIISNNNLKFSKKLLDLKVIRADREYRVKNCLNIGSLKIELDSKGKPIKVN